MPSRSCLRPKPNSQSADKLDRLGKEGGPFRVESAEIDVVIRNLRVTSGVAGEVATAVTAPKRARKVPTRRQGSRRRSSSPGRGGVKEASWPPWGQVRNWGSPTSPSASSRLVSRPRTTTFISSFGVWCRPETSPAPAAGAIAALRPDRVRTRVRDRTRRVRLAQRKLVRARPKPALEHEDEPTVRT